MPKALELAGSRFTSLSVVRVAFSRRKHRYWLCLCDCGNEVLCPTGQLTSGGTKSCGCYSRSLTVARQTTHGLSKSFEYRTWNSMRSRCRDVADPRYGGRGIRVCARWESDFLAFLADMGKAPSRRHTVERVDNDGPYAPGNCRWATTAEQARNRSTNVRLSFGGRTMIVSDWAAELGISMEALSERLARWPLEKALSAPRMDTRASGRRPVTHCPRGHLYRLSGGRKRCRVCEYRADKRWPKQAA